MSVPDLDPTAASPMLRRTDPTIPPAEYPELTYGQTRALVEDLDRHPGAGQVTEVPVPGGRAAQGQPARGGARTAGAGPAGTRSRLRGGHPGGHHRVPPAGSSALLRRGGAGACVQSDRRAPAPCSAPGRWRWPGIGAGSGEVPAGLLAAPGPTGACADGGRRRGAVLAHLGAGVARGRWAFGCGGPGIARSKPSAPPTRATRCSTRATPAWTPTARRPARTGWSSNVLQRPPARRTPRRAGRQASVAAAGGGRPAPALPPGRVEATHAPGFANGRRVAERLGIDLADPAAGRRPGAKRGGVTTSGRLRCGRAPARVPCCSGLSRGLCVVVPIVVPISRAVSSIGRAADF